MIDPYRNVVVLFMNHILKNKPYTIYGNGEMRRSFSYVGDVVDIIGRCGFENVAGMTFNVGSDRNWSINELSAHIQKITGGLIDPIYLPLRAQEVDIALCDHSLVKKTFGYKDTPFDKALEETWEWVRKQGPQEYTYTKLEISNDLVPKNWK